MLTLTLRYMRTADIPQVVAIDARSFDPPWSARSYHYEVNESTYSHMVVLEQQVDQAARGWRRLFPWLSNGAAAQRTIVGYGGLWHVVDEAHISTIAVHPDWRGHGYGELLLAAMIRRALMLDAAYIVLEVRVSNTTAQSLYQKYAFRTFGVKANYYRSNNEDAYDMRLDLTDELMIARFEQQFAAIRARHSFADHYTEVERPQR